MDNLENTPTSPKPSSELENLREECESLRKLLTVTLVLMILVTGVINFFLLRQAKYSRVDAENMKSQEAFLNQTINEYKASLPLMTNFTSRLVDFGRTHPDFQPVLARYGLRPNAGTNQGPAPLGRVPTQTAPKPAK